MHPQCRQRHVRINAHALAVQLEVFLRPQVAIICSLYRSTSRGGGCLIGSGLFSAVTAGIAICSQGAGRRRFDAFRDVG